MTQYSGLIVELPVGVNGLRTDDPDSVLQAGHLVTARNLNLQNGAIEKATGSIRWNQTPMSTGIKAAIDWWPDDAIQRLIVVCGDGKVYRFIDRLSRSEVIPLNGAPSSLNTSQYANIAVGGAEETGNNRKLFIMTGYNPIQVISGDATSRQTIANPVGDFSGTNQPLDGVVFRGRLFVFLRNGHSVFASSALNHEDFATLSLPYTIFPGESEKVSCLFTYRSKLFAMKYPRGLYAMNDSDPDAANWYFERITASFGAPSSRSQVPVFDDTFIANEYGGVTSLVATNATGDVKASDLFAQLRVQRFVRSTLLPEGRGIRAGVYYPDKKTAMFIYRGRSSVLNNYILNIDFQDQTTPKIVWFDKDQANCIFLRKDIIGVERPLYGSEDGYVYTMDQPDYWVGSSDGLIKNGYTHEWQTPHFDLAQGNPTTGDSNKSWEFFQLMYVPTGKWNVNVDVYIDGNFHKTMPVEVGSRSDLDFMHLDQDVTASEVEVTTMVPIQGLGKRISFRVYDSTAGRNYKITKIRVYYKISGSQDRK